MVIEITDKDKEDVLEQVEELGEAYMRWSSICGQSVILALQKILKLPGGMAALNAANFTGAGIAGMGHMCGALLGGTMAIGLAAGGKSSGELTTPEGIEVRPVVPPQAHMIVRRYYQKFLQEFGGWICRDLQIKKFGRGYEWGLLGELKKWNEAGGMELCGPIVGKAARMAAESIFELPRR